MVSHNAEYSFIVVDCLFGSECDNDSCLGLLVCSAFKFGERKDVLGVSNELKCSGEITFIDNI